MEISAREMMWMSLVRFCENCKILKRSFDLWPTRDGVLLCVPCANILDGCEVCGSIKPKDGSEQLHYEEDCFK